MPAVVYPGGNGGGPRGLQDVTPGGIGLNNTRERLAALHGDAASVSLSREDEATVFRIRMPAKVSA